MNESTKPTAAEWEELRGRLAGALVRPDDAEYDEARAVWNARIDRRPAAVARCKEAADVIAALRFAAERGMVVAVRGGGHDYAGNSVCDDGLVIDLSAMNEVTVDPASKTVRVQAGARWNAVDRAALEHGLVTVGGTVSTVGVAGFTLGGGMGHLTGLHGLAADNLLAADVVTVRGEEVRATPDDNPDLFWAIRGGGGNFGIVTSFEFRLHPAAREVLAGQIVYPYSDVERVLRAYRDVTIGAPDEFCCYAFILPIPPVPAFPEELHGEVAVDLVVVHAGDPDEGRRLVEPLRKIGEPILEAVGPQPYLDVQQTFDAGVPKGLRWYSRGSILEETLSDGAIETIATHAAVLPGPFTMVYVMSPPGAAARVDPYETAYPHRFPAYHFHVLAGWADAANDAENIAWTRRFHEAMSEHTSAGVYVNLLSEDETGRVGEAYGANLERLAAVKRKWDPDNVLRCNHNIPPSGIRP